MLPATPRRPPSNVRGRRPIPVCSVILIRKPAAGARGICIRASISHTHSDGPMPAAPIRPPAGPAPRTPPATRRAVPGRRPAAARCPMAQRTRSMTHQTWPAAGKHKASGIIPLRVMWNSAASQVPLFVGLFVDLCGFKGLFVSYVSCQQTHCFEHVSKAVDEHVYAGRGLSYPGHTYLRKPTTHLHSPRQTATWESSFENGNPPECTLVVCLAETH